MEYEQTIKDERGTIRIKVNLVTFSYGQTDRDGNAFRYDVNVWFTPKWKRKELSDNYKATSTEIWDTKMRLWNSIKP